VGEIVLAFDISADRRWALPICSRSRVYAEWEGRVPIAETPAEFLEHVQWAVTHRDEVREQAAAAHEYVLAERTIASNAWWWEQALGLSASSSGDPILAAHGRS
jgi:hypothetical protein